jgi:hypothetical protein
MCNIFYFVSFPSHFILFCLHNKFCGYNLCVAGLHKLSLLNLEGCPVTVASLASLSGFYSVQVLGFSAGLCIPIPIQI